MNFLFGSAKVANTDLILGEIAVVLIVMVVCFATLFILRKVVKKERVWLLVLRAVLKIVGFTLLLEALVLFLRFEGIYPFESRGWATVIGLGGLVFLAWTLLRLRRVMPFVEGDTTRFEHYDRYLPKPKKK